MLNMRDIDVVIAEVKQHFEDVLLEVLLAMQGERSTEGVAQRVPPSAEEFTDAELHGPSR